MLFRSNGIEITGTRASRGPVMTGGERIVDVLMPQLGETVAEGKILSWFKSVGEDVKPGDKLFEVETDNAVAVFSRNSTSGVVAVVTVSVIVNPY